MLIRIRYGSSQFGASFPSLTFLLPPLAPWGTRSLRLNYKCLDFLLNLKVVAFLATSLLKAEKYLFLSKKSNSFQIGCEFSSPWRGCIVFYPSSLNSIGMKNIVLHVSLKGVSLGLNDFLLCTPKVHVKVLLPNCLWTLRVSYSIPSAKPCRRLLIGSWSEDVPLM